MRLHDGHPVNSIEFYNCEVSRDAFQLLLPRSKTDPIQSLIFNGVFETEFAVDCFELFCVVKN